jgi:hypothetical protein
MGLDHTDEGLKILSTIDDFSTELYSVNQSALDLGDLAAAIGTVSTKGGQLPSGVRKIVQDATDTLTAEGKANRLLASVGKEMNDLAEQLRVLRSAKKDAKAANEIELLEALDEQLKIIGGRFFKVKKSYLQLKKTSGKVTDEMTDARLQEIEAENILDLGRFNAAEMNGQQFAIRQYQLTQKRAVPNLDEWRKFAARSGVTKAVMGKSVIRSLLVS